MTSSPLFTRRGLLALGTGSLALTAWPAHAIPIARPIHGHVSDTRFPGLGLPILAAGAWHQAIDGDVTALWYDRLDRGWRDPAAGAVAGLTGADALFVLEHLAWDRQRRVVLRQDVPLAGGPVPLVRWVIAPRGIAA